jgi:predicted dithiol-disulfide oxidoreductase (DUF899 family)
MPQPHKVVSHEKWLEARRQFLRKEKAFTRLRDRLSRERRSLPWERVDKTYVFEGPDGKETHRDVTMVAVSRAPYRKLAAYKKRVGWQFKWLSSAGNDFNFDYEVSFRPEDLATGRALYNFKKIHDPSVLDQPGSAPSTRGREARRFIPTRRTPADSTY